MGFLAGSVKTIVRVGGGESQRTKAVSSTGYSEKSPMHRLFKREGV